MRTRDKFRQHSALLQWVLINGQLQHVSTYAQLKPSERPEALCPVCEDKVVMKLGKIKVHHVAHQTGSNCVLTQPESALHFNCKMHIAELLRNVTVLKVSELCRSCGASRREIVWQKNWDEVRVERKLSDGLQPDIALWKNGHPLAAIEVFVTHAVDEEKAKRLRALKIPWVEIPGEESLYLGDTAWHSIQSLPISKHSWQTQWQCNVCVEREIAKQEWEKRAKEEKEWNQNNGEQVICFKLMDWYFPYGRWLRCLFMINKMLQSGQIVEFNLTYLRSSLNYDRIKSFDSDHYYLVSKINDSTNEHDAIATLIDKGKIFLKRQIQEHQIRLDSPMPWVYGKPPYFEDFDNHNFPRRYFFNRKTRQWFLPKDTKEEKWYENDGTPIRRFREYWHRP